MATKKRKNMKKKRNTGSLILTVFLALIAAAILVYFAICLAEPIVFGEFSANSEAAAAIPGMKEGFIPQGLAYSEDADVYLLCGYMNSSDASRIYVVSSDGKAKELRLKNIDGTVYKGHAGGISCYDDHVYLSNAGKIFHISLSTLLKASDLQYVKFDGSFDVPCRSSYTFCDGNVLYVGEFHHTGYVTDDSHAVKLSDGSENRAMVFGYTLSTDKPMGVFDSSAPKVAYSVRDKVQGFAVMSDGRVALSCSFGLDDSHLYLYKLSQPVRYTYNDKEIPLYVMEDSLIEKDVKMPFMSEDIDVIGDSIIINFESSAVKYGGGMLPFSQKNIVKYNIAG